MNFNLFGWELRKSKEEEKKQKADSFVLPENQDGAVNVEGVAGAYGAYIDFDGTVKNEFELITRYRELSLLPDVDSAIDDVINEMIVMDGHEDSVKINLSISKTADEVKKKIEEEFLDVLRLLDWNNQAYEIARKWYIDGRLYYHIILDESNPKKGILELRYIDPRQIRKVREVKREIDNDTGAQLLKVTNEYFTYNTRGMRFNAANSFGPISTAGGIKITTDSVCYVHSGIVDKYSASILSHLHKAIKPINQLKMMEDALVIYRIARAPERRIFYVDVGNLPKSKAEDYLRSIMTRYRNKLQYNIETGEIKDDRRFMSMLEDYWLPRREGSQGTSIDTLPGGENLSELADVEYFQKKVYKALNVPISRMEAQQGFQIGRAAEITRDEVKFSKFIHRIRLRFSHLFDELLEKQLVLKNIVSKDEWEVLKDSIKYDFNIDNHYAELKDSEILQNRLQVLQSINEYEGKYYSKEWIRKNVLLQSESEIEEINSQIETEKKDNPPEDSSDNFSFESKEMDSKNSDDSSEVDSNSLINLNSSYDDLN